MTDFLLLAFIFLCAGVIAVPIASRLGLGSVLGYLIAGIVISPALTVLDVNVESIQHFAEFGVVMMLFLVGLELEPKLLWGMRTRLIGLGGGQVLLTTLATMAIAMLLGQVWSVALAIGLIFALSSTAIVLQTLNEKGLMKSEGGQGSFSVLLFQDIAVIPMLALIPLLALPNLDNSIPTSLHTTIEQVSHTQSGSTLNTTEHYTETNTADSHSNSTTQPPAEAEDGHGNMSLVNGLSAWQSALVTLAAIAAVVLGGNYLTTPLFRFIAEAQLRELFTAAALMIVIGIALLMSLVGLSPALGTFLAGVVLANSEYRHELESDIDPFKGLLLGLFFMTVGASINFSLLAEHLFSTVALTLGLMLLKALVLLLLSVVFKIRDSNRWLMALGLAQAGEFGFVLLSFTVANNVIPNAIADRLLLVVALSMLLTPALFILFDRVVVPFFTKTQQQQADEITESNHIVIAGVGRVGGIVNRMLAGAGHKATVLDYNSKHLEVLGKFGMKAYFGDATRPDLLHAAGIEDAKLLVVAVDGKEQISQLVSYVIKNYPNVHVMARAIDRDHVYQLYALGCRDIIRESYDSSLRMGRSAFEALGISHDKAVRMMQHFDEMDRNSIVALADVYDTNVHPTENAPYIAKVREMMTHWEEELQVKLKKIIEEKE